MVGRRFRWLAILIFILSGSPCNADTEAAPPPEGIHAIVTLKNGSKINGYLTAISIPKKLFQIVSDVDTWTFYQDEIASIGFSDGYTIDVEHTNTTAPVPQENKIRTGNLAIEAAIVYKLGGVQPIARNRFDLVAFSDSAVAKKFGSMVGDIIGRLMIHKKVNEAMAYNPYPLSRNYENESLEEILNDSTKKEMVSLLAECSVQSQTTDFGGKAQFGAVPFGIYALFGIAQTRSNFAVWFVPVIVNDVEEKFTLDQNNARYAE